MESELISCMNGEMETNRWRSTGDIDQQIEISEKLP